VLLRAGDSLILFTDGVTEARHHASRGLYGDDRLRDLIAGLHGMPAAGTADAIQQAVLEFGGGKASDDTVTLVLTVPPAERAARQGAAAGMRRCGVPVCAAALWVSRTAPP
jgi:Stage II sporulation protein E (SpoIIE)